MSANRFSKRAAEKRLHQLSSFSIPSPPQCPFTQLSLSATGMEMLISVFDLKWSGSQFYILSHMSLKDFQPVYTQLFGTPARQHSWTVNTKWQIVADLLSLPAFYRLHRTMMCRMFDCAERGLFMCKNDVFNSLPDINVLLQSEIYSPSAIIRKSTTRNST